MSEQSIAVAPKSAAPVLSQALGGGMLQRKCACGQHTLGGECEACGKKKLLQRYAASPTMPPIPPVALDVLRSSGRPLETPTRLSMESSFKHDFSRVRVHTDDLAGLSAGAVNAQAYTVGQDIVFGANRYSPGTAAGRRLIAHELCHVIQQSTGAESHSLNLDAAEGEADRAAERAVAGLNIKISRSTPRHLARQSDDEPTSLHASFDPSTKKYSELEEELGKIHKWLEEHPGSSVDRTNLEAMQIRIVETMKRLDKAMGRSTPFGFVDLRPFSKSPQQTEEAGKLSNIIAPPQPSPFQPAQTPSAKTESPLEKFAREHAKEILQLPQWNERFVQGLLRSPLSGKLGQAWEQLKSDLTSVSRGVPFYMGMQVGVPVGAVKDVWDQLKSIIELYIKALILKFRIDTEPLKVWSELKKFAQSLPDLILKLFDAEQLGVVAGEMLATKVDQEFVKKGPYDQGYLIGEIIGTVLMEVALLFVGVEEVSAAIKAIRATELGEQVARGMATASRELKALLEVGKVLKPEAELAEGAAKGEKALGKAEEVAKPGIKILGVDEAVEREISSLGAMDAHSEAVLRANPELRRALVENPLAADALKLCKSPCLPDFASPEQVKRLNNTLEKFRKSGINIDSPKLKEYLHAQPDHVSLSDALDRLEEAHADLATQGKLTDEHFVGEAKKLEEELGVRERKPPEATMSEAREGQAFDRQQRPRYPANEVPIRDKGGVRRRLDSYDPVKGEIVSRKSLASTNGQIAMADEFTMIDYFQEFALKYPNGATIADGPGAGQIMKGKYILEVPVQEYPIPSRILSEAKARNITIRDIKGKIY